MLIDLPQPPRPRVPFRRNLEGAPPPPAAAFGFGPPTEAAASDRDVLLGYQVFLGRDPENSFVISEARANRLIDFLRGMMRSPEFQETVVRPLAAGRAPAHARVGPYPTATHKGWLASILSLDTARAAALEGAATWQALWTALAGLPGYPDPSGAAPAAAPARAAPVAEPMAGGFVLIQIDQPKPGDRVQPGAVLSGAGWAIAPADIEAVEIYLDGALLAHAKHGLPRPDVARNFPHYRHVESCGFAFSATVPPGQDISEASELAVAVRTVRGEAGRRSVGLLPAQPRTGAAAETWPIRVFAEEVRLDPAGNLQLRGWALARAPLEEVAVYLGTDRLGEARLGIERPDIAAQYPTYPNARQSGLVFEASLKGRRPGPASLRLQAAAAGERRQVILPLTIPPGAAPAKAAKAAAAAPASQVVVCSCDRAVVGGTLLVSGWAFAPGGLAAIEAAHGGTVLGAAELGGLRADVAAAYPDAPEARHSGFRLQMPAPEGVGAGDVLTLTMRAETGERRVLEVTLEAAPEGTASAASAAAPAPGTGMRLEIDNPTLEGDRAGSPVRGALTIAGWAVAPAGIESIELFCDDRPLGRAYLGMRREDIARVFPDHKGALLAGWALVLPPGAMAEGGRAIRVVAREAGGDTMERRFALDVEAADSVAGSTIRRTMPRAEVAFGLTLLGQQPGGPPPFRVYVVPAPDVALAPTLASLAAQTYPHWSAVVVRSNAQPGEVEVLAAFPDLEARAQALPLRRIPAPKAGELCLMVRAGDELGCDALLELAIAHALPPRPGLVYADDLRPDPAHGKRATFHKPAWSPELLLGLDYVSRAASFRAEILAPARLDVATLLALPDHDAALRLAEAAGPIGHVPKVLVARGPALFEASGEAIAAALARRGEPGEVRPLAVAGLWKPARRVPAPPRISIVMPTCGGGDHIRTCIPSIRGTTAGLDVEIVVLDNVADPASPLKAWLLEHADIVVDMPEAFNWSRFNNVGAAAATGEVLLFLNDDVEAIEAGWLDALLQHALRPQVGVVGAKLLYPDGKVQHAGQFLAETHARHAFRFADRNDPGPFGLALVAREMMSVTGACMAVRRDVFDRLHGFDEAHTVINNDLDFCLRARDANYAVVYTPHAELIHHELASRAAILDIYDEARFESAWRLRFLEGDPYHTARLMTDSDHYTPDAEPVVPIHVGPEGPAAADVRRILAVKLDHIGDYLTALPALEQLRRRFPGAEITLLAPPATAALARAGGVADDIVEFSFFHARSGLGQKEVSDAEFEVLGARLAAGRFDMAIDLRLVPDTREVLRHTGAPFLVGYDYQGRFPWLTVSLEWEGDARLLAKRQHVSERLVQLVAAAEAACQPLGRLRPGAVLPARTAPGLRDLPETFLARPLVCVHPGVGNVVRQWPAKHYAALIDMLAARAGVAAVLIGGPDEQQIADEVLAHVTQKERVASLVGRVKLSELGQVMQACAMFVGNNSGPKHLAASLGVPTLGIHSFVVDAAEWGPLGPAAFAVRKQMVCGPCYLEFASDCPRNLACLNELKPRAAYAACLRLLAMRPPPAEPARRPRKRAATGAA